ncbi:MAG: type I toxin-antitoxin system SymE family toxin [Acetatifactor sp.]|nr:type I toxin-antitoxin system SymE family toxin [Acetatifactor sp.]
MAKKRSVKVYGQSGYKYRETPTIMLKGLWLKEAGFDIGDYISVTCEDGKIIIAQDAERAAVKAAEAEFMEREMKALQKRYEAEKVKIRVQMVADAYDVTLIINNTRHVWYIHNVELKDRNLCMVYHKHKISHPITAIPGVEHFGRRSGISSLMMNFD